MKEEKKFVPTLMWFLQGHIQTDLVTGKRKVKVKNERTHYFKNNLD